MSLFTRNPNKNAGDEKEEKRKFNPHSLGISNAMEESEEYEQSTIGYDEELATITRPTPPRHAGKNDKPVSFRKPKTQESYSQEPAQSSSRSATPRGEFVKAPVIEKSALTNQPLNTPPTHEKAPEVKQTKPTEMQSLASNKYNSYGINQTISLLERLPEVDDPSILMTIVKRTLEATGINIQDIIRDALEKKNSIQSNIDTLEAEVSNLEKQLKRKRVDITTLTEQLREVERVQNMLELSELPPAKGFLDTSLDKKET